jgi:5'(3')-deoxyribonucleotidase
MSLLIAVDIDNCLNNLTEAILEVYNADSGDNLSLSDITAYHIENFVKPAYKDNFFHYFLDREVWKKIKVQPHCREIIARLFNEGHRIIFVTTTEPENLPKKKNWLMRNFPFLNIRKSLFSCPVKQLVKCDILIDDCLGNLTDDRGYYSVCLDYPWNKSNLVDYTEPCFTRANDWIGVYEKVKMVESLIKENVDE